MRFLENFGQSLLSYRSSGFRHRFDRYKRECLAAGKLRFFGQQCRERTHKILRQILRQIKRGQACDLRFYLIVVGVAEWRRLESAGAMARKARAEVEGGLYHVIARQ